MSLQSEEPYLQFGYEVLTFPVAEFAQIFGPLIYAINQAWPVQVFGMGSQDELVELSFTKEGTAPTIQQKNVSGIPCAELRDLYFCVKFPDPLAADCMFRLLDAVEKKSAAVALEWEYADFLEQQRLARIDRTLSYCYVSFEEEESAGPGRMAFRTDASAEMRTVADVFGKAAISAGIRMAQRCNAPGSCSKLDRVAFSALSCSGGREHSLFL